MTLPNLKGKSFLSLLDFTAEELLWLIELSADLKAMKKRGITQDLLKGKHIALLFEKTSTRTRCAFETAVYDEGGHVTFLDPISSQMGKKESIEDTAKVLARYYDGIEYRGYSQKTLEVLRDAGGVPVFNGLSDVEHPTQILADLLTIQEHCPGKGISDLKVVFVGDVRNNVAATWNYASKLLGFKFVGFGPKELFGGTPESHENALYTEDISCIEGADAVYTDIWASMGEEDIIEERVKLLGKYKVTAEIMAATKNENCLFLHCLPSFHNFETELAKEWIEKGVDIREVDDDVFRSKNSVVFDEAENRMHTIKAIMVATVSDKL
ncbi:MAG: ornithine carbamoyltransferase [Eubacteriaceae bacterium]|nr:ornithine carbamoyltransferase [Eubacteriaceae bacterium]